MTDLERERVLIDELYAGDKGLFYWNDEDTRRIAKALAAARREGAEAAKDDIAQLKGDIEEVERAAFIRGAEEMREQAARALPHYSASVVRALPAPKA